MTAAELEAYLHRTIPLSAMMGVQVVSVLDGVRLAAPLAPNINHQGTAFGGSVASLATLAAWSLIRVETSADGIVVANSNIQYRKPVEGAFEAFAPRPTPEAWEAFKHDLNRSRKGRVTLEARVEFKGRVCAKFTGLFVATYSSDE